MITLLLLAQQPLSIRHRGEACHVKLLRLAFSDFWITLHSRIVSPAYDRTVYLGLEPMTCMFV